MLVQAGVASLLRGSQYKVVANVSCASLFNANHPASAEPRLAILTADKTIDSAVAQNIQSLRTRFPALRIIVVGASCAPIDQLSQLGANGFVADVSSKEVLLKAIDLASNDYFFLVLSPRQAPGPAPTESSDSLPLNQGADPPRTRTERELSLFSTREQQVMRELADGHSNKQIARTLNITESTVKVHLKALLRKVAARNRTQAAIWAVANGYSHSDGLDGVNRLTPAKDNRLQNNICAA